jgi:hypothetical protein
MDAKRAPAAGAAAGSCVSAAFAPARQGGAQPHAIDHRRNHGRQIVRLIGRHEFLERTAQIRERAPLVHRLHPPQALHLQHLSPKGEPRRAGALIEFFGCQICIDDGLDARARSADLAQSTPHMIADASRQGAERGVEQAVLVAEIMCDQPRRHARSARYLRKCRAHVAKFG